MLARLAPVVRRDVRLPAAATARAFCSTASVREEVPPAWSDPDARLRPYGQGSPPAGLRAYAVVALDKQVEGTLERRLAVRGVHLAEAAAGKRVGRVLSGGGLLGSSDFPPSSAPAEETASQLAGSLLIVLAENASEVLARVKRDIYWRHGVWDPENTTIMPYAMAPSPQPADAAAETNAKEP